VAARPGRRQPARGRARDAGRYRRPDRGASLPGREYLLITLQPARAHDSSGGSTVTRSAQALGYPTLKGYALAGDFEGVVTLALGLDGPVSIRIGELPGHWYIDVRA
jgi:hypothetical protein